MKLRPRRSPIDDLLDLSRGLLAFEQAKPQIERRRHRLEAALNDLHPLVMGDHKRPVQVAANRLANAAKDTPEGGLGLGLALVKRLGELHGGSVAAFSAGPGQGSCFVLTLPCSGGPSWAL